MTIENKEINNQYLDEIAQELQCHEEREKQDTRNLKLIIYPSLIAFAVLATYGFYLIQSLTTDIADMSVSVMTMNDAIARNMDKIATISKGMEGDMERMMSNIGSMSQSTRGISSDMVDMTQLVSDLRMPMNDMDKSTANMQLDVGGLNKSISTPMSMFNNFIP